MLSLPRLVLLLSCLCAGELDVAAASGTVLVRHGPTIKGNVEGSIQLLTGETTSIEGTANISGDLLVPGVPTVVLKSGINYGGTLVGTGATSPSGYTVTINTKATLGHLVTRTNAVALPAVTGPMSPSGTRTVTIKKSTDTPGNFATLKNLTLEKGVGAFAIPAGAYGSFTAKSDTSFVLGVAGAQSPTIYEFQSLALETGSAVVLLGPVIINLAAGLAVNGTIGQSANPAWLELNLYSGNLTLNTGSYLYGALKATRAGSAVTIKANAQLVGSLACDRLSVESGGVVRPLSVVHNQAPSVSLSAPADGAIFPTGADLTVQASATDADGTVARVAFYIGSTLLGEANAAPFQYLWQNLQPGSYVLTAKATDDVGASTTSEVVNISVVTPPVITSATTATAQVGAPFSYQVTAANHPISFSVTGLPAGFSLSATTGLISGTPATAGVYSVGLTATNAGGTGVATLALTVTSAGSITSPSIAAGKVGASFSFQITASNSPTTFGADGLPPGLTIDSASGLISGTPTRPGVSRVLITATGTGEPVSSTLSVTILATFPYTADFEASEGFVEGALDSQLGWVVDPGTASIDFSDAFTGLRSASLLPSTPPAVVTQTFAPASTASVVFADFFAKPVARASAAAGTVFSAGPARFALQISAGAQGFLYSYSNDNTGVAGWSPTTFSVALDTNNRATTWTRFTARADFSRSIWDLYVDGRMIAFGLRFPGELPANQFTIFQVQGDTGTASRIDDLYAGETHPLFADLNSNGIDDAWETAHGLSLSAYNRDDSPAGNGVTVIQAYVADTDPNDFYAGKPPGLTIVGGNNQVSPPGAVNPLPFSVEIRDGSTSALLANAPVTFSVVAGGGQMSVGGAGDAATATTMTIRTGPDGRAGVYYLQPLAESALSLVRATAGLSELTFTSTSSGSSAPALLVAGGDSALWQDVNGPPRLWGANAEGQLGDGTLQSRAQMKRLSGTATTFHRAALGAGHGVACDRDGQLITWGDNYFGQLGDGSLISRTAAAPIARAKTFTDVAAGDHHTLALASDGQVYAWGDNRRGQLGDGSQVSRRAPRAIPGANNVIAIGARADFSAALKADGTVWVWGANDFGQLSAPLPWSSSAPQQVGTFSGAQTIVAGRNFLLVLTSAGTVSSWGASYAGQLGRAPVSGSFAPNTVAGLANIVEIAAGDRHGAALDANGTVWAWGANDVGQLGDGGVTPRVTPIALDLPPVRAIAAGGDHLVAVKADGSLIAWGANDAWQLGSASTDRFSATPTAVLPPND